MAELLYLDAARLGQMSPTAAKMYADFGRLAVEVPTGPCTENFLFHGTDAAPEIAEQYPELARWPGIDGLKQLLKTAFASNASADTQVLLANRTTELMKFGVRSVLNRCDRVLLTDLTWPPYLLWMLEHFGRSGIDVSLLPLKHAVWKEGRSADDIAEMILTQLRTNNCDGVFLPAITHTGIKLPITTILNELHHRQANTATVIDASQAFGHIDTNSWTHLADFTFGGMHKWVRAYLPLAVGFLPVPYNSWACADLKRFHPCLRNETINISPFLTTYGALRDLPPFNGDILRNGLRLIGHRLSKHDQWKRISADVTLQSRIELIRSMNHRDIQKTRKHLAQSGIIATVFPDGTVRLSLPQGCSSRSTTNRDATQVTGYAGY